MLAEAETKVQVHEEEVAALRSRLAGSAVKVGEICALTFPTRLSRGAWLLIALLQMLESSATDKLNEITQTALQLREKSKMQERQRLESRVAPSTSAADAIAEPAATGSSVGAR